MSDALTEAVWSLCDGMTPGFFFKDLLPPGMSPEIVLLHRIRDRAKIIMITTGPKSASTRGLDYPPKGGKVRQPSPKSLKMGKSAVASPTNRG